MNKHVREQGQAREYVPAELGVHEQVREQGQTRE